MNDTPTPRTDERKASFALDTIRQLETELAAVTEQRDEALEYADKLAQGLPDGMLPKDVEVLREANCGLAMELTAVTKQRDQWKDKYIQQNKDLGHELRDPNGTIWSECKRLQTELTAARQEIDMLKSKYADHHAEAERLTSEINAVTEQRDGLRSGIDYASDQLRTVTEQLDQFENKLRIELRGHPDSKLWGDAGLIAATMRSVDAIDEVIDQRDRLAEAGKDLLKNLYNTNDDGVKIATIRRMKEALQSLTTKEQ